MKKEHKILVYCRDKYKFSYTTLYNTLKLNKYKYTTVYIKGFK